MRRKKRRHFAILKRLSINVILLNFRYIILQF